ncbi:DUF6082 family protein [Streptomyces sp. NPDC005805]|uniref:DUF6082 family protein n=1 Tax=Streptomyces sp. NPDC005805 TaxID=3157068 RepID=UPI0033FB4A97
MRFSAGRLAWIAAGVLGAFGVILLTPFLLKAVGPKDADWERLSQISQAYGALSVILSAGALAGVALSLAHQARQNRIATEETTWSAHRELLLLSLSDTEFLPCWEPPTIPVSQEEWRRMVFTNLIIQDWEKTYVFGLMSDAQLVRTFEVHFQGQTARDHWRNSRVHYLRHAEAGTNRRTRRFAQTADRCYEAAVAAGEAVAASAYFGARPPVPGQPSVG